MDNKAAGKIDTHQHSYPDAYIAFLQKLPRSPAGWSIEPWTADIGCKFCEATNIDTAILSCIPGGPSTDTHLEQARQFTKDCNDFNAKLRDSDPHRYGFFASISNLCDTDLALEEINYAFDVLHADGVTLATSYAKQGQTFYLGHPDFVSVWDALDARGAVVFVHPIPSPSTIPVHQRLPVPVYDFPHETGRTAIDLITNSSQTLLQHAKHCKIILSHAGGDLPFLIDRAAGVLAGGPQPIRLVNNKGDILSAARRFYYDTALSSSPMHLSALFELLGPENWDHVLVGTDFPPGGSEAIAQFTQQLEQSKFVNMEELRANALKLFPRLRVN